MIVGDLLEKHNYPTENVSSEILALDFGENVIVEKYGVMKWDLFDGAKLLCDNGGTEVVLNFEDDSEFAPLSITYSDADGFVEFGFDDAVGLVYVNDNGDVL